MPTNTIEFGALVTGLAGGLALFLFGMRQLTESLKVVAGSSMKNLLTRLTANRFTGALAGMIITAVIQSSSVTTVLVVGFVSAGLLTLSQSIGVIIGANIGTTITAQMIAFNIAKYGLLAIAIGFLIDAIGRSEKVKQWGMMLMGLGLVFFGMELMSSATGPLRQWPPFIDAMRNIQNPLLNIAIGAVFTAIVQSSSATTGIIIVLASQGLINLESGIGLVLGANVGTCVTAVIAAFRRPREAVQAAWIHIIFNVGGVLLWMFLIPQFADLVRSLSYSSSSLEEPERLAAEVPRQIANAHTLFNIGNALIFIWLTGPLAKLVEWIVPRRDEPMGMGPKYLDEMYFEQPALAIDQVRRELVRLGELNQSMLDQTFSVVTTGTHQDIARLRQAEHDINTLHGAIITYLAKLSQKNLVEPQTTQLNDCIGIANYLENVGDIIENNLLSGAVKRMNLGVVMSPSTVEILSVVHAKVCWAFGRSIEGLRTGDKVAAKAAAEEAIQSKAEVNALGEKAAAHLTLRLVAYEPNRLAAFTLETDIIENFKRINTLTRRIARIMLKTNSQTGIADESVAEAS